MICIYKHKLVNWKAYVQKLQEHISATSCRSIVIYFTGFPHRLTSARNDESLEVQKRIHLIRSIFRNYIPNTTSRISNIPLVSRY